MLVSTNFIWNPAFALRSQSIYSILQKFHWKYYGTYPHYTSQHSTDSKWKNVQMTRFVEEVDAVVVGGGPSGLAVACRLKQLANSSGNELRVVVLEKAPYIGGHTISGACIEPTSLFELFPNWKELQAPLHTPVTGDSFYMLTKNKALPIPLLPGMPMANHGNYIVRLGNLVKWMGDQAESLGVEVYSGVAATEVLYDNDGSIQGVATNDVGIHKDGSPKDTFQRGMEFRSKQVFFAEGCRGHLTKEVIRRFNLHSDCDPQCYGLGLKELWEVPEAQWNPGHVEHGVGWPLKNNVYGGYFIYHLNEGSPLLAIGLVIGLDYENPYINPFKEFQRLKHHPHIARLLTNGKRISYGARALNESGYQSIPHVTVPGGLLIGCASGLLNVPKIKGIHNAIRSGRIAAECAFEELVNSPSAKPIEITSYSRALKLSPIWKELYEVRNIRPSFHTLNLGMVGMIFYTGTIWYLFKGKEPWTLHNNVPNHLSTKSASNFKPILYPKPDGVLSFDLLSSVQLTGTNHEHDQPIHLVLKNNNIPEEINLPKFNGIEQRYCPAGVYEYVQNELGTKLQINAQNCIHCKTCDIKDPTQNINWVAPQGGEGPSYQGM